MPSACEQERIVMEGLPDVLKTVYSLSKLFNRSTHYREGNGDPPLKSYELKNALLFYLEQQYLVSGLSSSDWYEKLKNGQVFKDKDATDSSKTDKEEQENRGTQAQCEPVLGPTGSEFSPDYVQTLMQTVCQNGLELLRGAKMYFGFNQWLGSAENHAKFERTVMTYQL